MDDTALPFWKLKTLAQLDAAEWESVCDGCGLCCLQKLEHEYDGTVFYTDVACKLLDLQSCRCSNYATRREHVPDCIRLTPEQAQGFKWLPPSCGYRLLSEGKELPAWHHLRCGDREQVHRLGISRAGRMQSETTVPEEDWESHIIFRCR